MFDTMSHVIPDGLDGMEPGPFLAAILSTIDVHKVSDHDRIVVLRAQKRMASHYEAGSYQTMAAVSDSSNDNDDDLAVAFEAAAMELQAGLRLTRRAADIELSLAVDLAQRLPRVLTAMAEGGIDRPRVRVMVTETAHLSVGTARDVIDQVIERAHRLTTGQLRALIRRLCIEVNPDEATQRYEKAVSDRMMVTEPTDTGTANILLLDTAPNLVAAAADHVNHLAKSLCGPDESRTMDQLRADVALDLLIGNPVAKPTRRGVVDIHLTVETLTRLAETPGDLAGYGPVVADIARQVAEHQSDSEWRWTLNHPETGLPVDNGTTRRRRSATASQTRQVQTRNPTCVFPGCRMPSTQCDLDHRIPYANGGPTCFGALVPLCRHHHTGRHQHGWEHQPLPNGDHLWTSPLGHTYTTSGRAPP